MTLQILDGLEHLPRESSAQHAERLQWLSQRFKHPVVKPGGIEMHPGDKKYVAKTNASEYLLLRADGTFVLHEISYWVDKRPEYFMASGFYQISGNRITLDANGRQEQAVYSNKTIKFPRGGDYKVYSLR